VELSIHDILTAVTIVTLLAVVVGDRVLSWLKTRGIDLSKMGEVYEIAYNTHEGVQQLLRRFDDSTLEDAIKALSDNVAVQTELLREMVAQNTLNRQEHKLILDQIERISKR